MASVFGIAPSQINELSSTETIAEWDSLKQINLIFTLEEEFGISFDTAQIIKMVNYPAIKETIETMVGKTS